MAEQIVPNFVTPEEHVESNWTWKTNQAGRRLKVLPVELALCVLSRLDREYIALLASQPRSSQPPSTSKRVAYLRSRHIV